MKNAHERFGWLEFEKQLKDTRTRLRVPLHRFIGEPAENKEVSGTCHLVSVFGNDVDIGAIWAGLAGQEWVTVSGPDLADRRVTLGKDPRIFRGSVAVAGRSRSVRHLVALSAQVADESDVGRIILSDDDPEFCLVPDFATARLASSPLLGELVLERAATKTTHSAVGRSRVQANRSRRKQDGVFGMDRGGREGENNRDS